MRLLLIHFAVSILSIWFPRTFLQNILCERYLCQAKCALLFVETFCGTPTLSHPWLSWMDPLKRHCNRSFNPRMKCFQKPRNVLSIAISDGCDRTRNSYRHCKTSSKKLHFPHRYHTGNNTRVPCETMFVQQGDVIGYQGDYRALLLATT